MGFSRLLVCATLFPACVQGLPRRLPERPTVDAFTMLPLSATGSAANVEAAGDGPLTLAGAFQLALARSELVTLSEREIVGAEIRWREKRTEVLPNLSLSATGILQRKREQGGTVAVPLGEVVGAARLQQPLFRKGYFASRTAGERARESAEAASRRDREQLARDVAEVFINVLRTRKLLELAKAAVSRAKTQSDLAAGRVKVGQALKNAELLAQIDLRRAELQELNATRDVGFADLAFQRLIGRAPPTQLEAPPSPTLPSPEQARALARRRADLRALELHVAENREEETAAEGRRWWPRFDLDASVQLNYPEVLGSKYDWQVLGIVTIPLIQSGREYVDIAARENETRIASLELEQQRKVVVEEIERAALQASSTTRAAELADKQVEVAREHYKLVDKQVRLGAITFLEVTNAQAVLVEAENAFEVATVDKLLAAYDYLFAIGALDLSK